MTFSDWLDDYTDNLSEYNKSSSRTRFKHLKIMMMILAKNIFTVVNWYFLYGIQKNIFILKD